MNAAPRRASPPPAGASGAELGRLLAAADEEEHRGRPVVLATVVDRRGSSYRRPGARLLVRSDGSSVGLVSGGCLEAEVVEQAHAVAERGEARVVTFDLTADEEAIWGWGLGCNGAIDVLLQPPRSSRAVLAALRRARASAAPSVLALALDGPSVGRHLLLTADGRADGDLAATDDLVAAARERLTADRPVRRAVARTDVLLEVVRAPLTLVVCGAGEDVDPVVQFATQLGWSVVVTDDRRARLPEGRFTAGTRTVVVDAADVADAVGLHADTYVVVMSHDFLRDAAYLAAAVDTDAAYIGLLGPARRRERLVAQLGRAGIRLGPRDRARIHGPAGLDIGAEGPTEIAWSICSEVLAVSRGRSARHLTAEEGQTRAQPTATA